MKKANRKSIDELRSEYRRSDFGALVSGKYAQRTAESTNVVVLEPQIARAFPTDRAVNTALRNLLLKRKKVGGAKVRVARTRRERRAG